MYPKPKYDPSTPGNESEDGQTRNPSGVGTGSQANYAGKGPVDWSQNQSYYWRSSSRFNRPSCEPEHSEAFVEESGIKVFETSNQNVHEDEDDDEDNGGHDGADDDEEDPLYQLDVLDDTIVEDDEDDDEDDDDEEEEDSPKRNEKLQTETKTNSEDQLTPCPMDILQTCDVTIVLSQSTKINVIECDASKLSADGALCKEVLSSVPSSSTASNSGEHLAASPPASLLLAPQLAWTTSSSSFKESNADTESTNSTNSSADFIDDPNNIQNGYSSDSGLRRLSIQSNSLPCIPIKSERDQSSGDHDSDIPVSIPEKYSVETVVPAVLPSTHLVNSVFASNCIRPTVPNAITNGNWPNVSVANNCAQPMPPFFQKPQSAPNSRPTSRSSSPLAIGLTGNMWAGLPQAKENNSTVTPSKQTQQSLSLSGSKGKGNRFILPLARINTPRHKFIIRRVNEQDSSAKRTTAFIDSRLGDLRCQDASRHAKANTSPVWIRRQFGQGDVNIGSGKTPQTADGKTGTDGSGTPVSGLHPKEQDRSKQQQDESDGNSVSSTPQQQQPQGFRPRAGTWSIANSRRMKIKQEKEEEAAKLRQRRKSGDDITAAANPPQPFSAAAGRKEDQPLGFFDSFRPRSKSDAKAILQSRQRRKSGDDLLNAATKDKDKKKEVTPGFLESFRPRSKSDAARGKKPNIMTTMKNAVQQTLVSPSGNNRGGRRSGEATPVEPHANDDVYHTWHAGSGPKSTIGKVWELFRHNKTNETSEERQRRKSGGKHDKGQLHRRHSMDPDRRRHGSGGFGAPYIRGDDPNQAAILFRDCRGLPAAAPFLENYKRSELEEDESQILVKFFKYHHTYDLIPTSAKLVIFDTRLQVKKAFYALVYNGVRAAPLWDATRQEFVGMLTITDFIRILQSFYNSANRKMEELEDHRLELWRSLLKDDGRKLISIGPNECLYDAIRSLIHQKIHRLPVIDPITGNVLYIITHKRILKFLYLYINELPKPMVLQKSLRELDIGTYDRIETARGETLIIEALNKFVERRISALPIVDDEGKLIDIYAKFDVINLAAEGTYHNLDVTLHEANEYRNEWFEGVLKCDLDESLGVVMERIVRAEVHRLVVVDKSNKVIGIISLSDILNELVLKPCNDDPLSMRNRTIGQMETSLSGGNPSPEINVESLSSDNEVQNSGGTAGDEDWGGGSDLSISEDKLQERKSSAESEENFDLEVNNMPDSMTSQGVISISS